MRLPRAALVSAALLVSFAAACGGNDSSSAEASFTTQANSLCERAADRAAQIPAPNTLADIEHVVEIIAPLNEQWNREFKALTPPPGGEEEFRKMVLLFEQDESLLAELGDAAADKDRPRVEDVLRRYDVVIQEEDRLWRLLGVPACTQIRLGTASEPSV